MNNQISFQDVYQTIQQRGEFKLGQRASTPDGREWVFVRANVAIGKNLIAIPQAVSTVTGGTVTSGTDSQKRIVYINSSGSSFTTGQFQDGIGLINVGTGTGQTFKIKTNTPTQIQLYPETALTTALSVSDSGFAILTMSDVTIAAITSTIQKAVGSAQTAFAVADYGWMLTEGDGGAISSQTLIIGSNFTTGDSTAGQVIKGVTGNGPFDAQSLGFVLVANSGANVAALVRYEIRG